MTSPTHPRWKHDGVCVVNTDQLDPNTAQTPGMDCKAAINFARTGAQKLQAGKVHIHPDPMKIEIDDLTRPAIHALLNEHLQSMYELSPPESVHALDLEKLRQPNITFWTAWDATVLLGCGALKQLDSKSAEVKSMRTPNALRRRGAGRAILAHLINVAQSRGYTSLCLETGTVDAFKPAQKLYESFGFVYVGPFGDYVLDPYSAFMRLDLNCAASRP